MSHKNAHRDRILVILKSNDGPMWIMDLRKHFKTGLEERNAVTSAIRLLDEQCEIRILGGYDRASKKMIEYICDRAIPMADKAVVVRLTNKNHWNYVPARQYCGVRGSTLGDCSPVF